MSTLRGRCGFQPMATGYFKVYSSPYDHFWCCTGSGMENFSKLSDSIYFYGADALFVNRYTSSKIDWKEKGLTITQNADLPTVKFTINGNAEGKIVPIDDKVVLRDNLGTYLAYQLSSYDILSDPNSEGCFIFDSWSLISPYNVFWDYQANYQNSIYPYISRIIHNGVIASVSI